MELSQVEVKLDHGDLKDFDVSKIRFKNMRLMSFGFKFGRIPNAKLILDVRDLPHPWDVLRSISNVTGLDPRLRFALLRLPNVRERLAQVRNAVHAAMMQHEEPFLLIAIGCNSGLHRSVSFVEFLYEELLGLLDSKAVIDRYHQDIDKMSIKLPKHVVNRSRLISPPALPSLPNDLPNGLPHDYSRHNGPYDRPNFQLDSAPDFQQHSNQPEPIFTPLFNPPPFNPSLFHPPPFTPPPFHSSLFYSSICQGQQPHERNTFEHHDLSFNHRPPTINPQFLLPNIAAPTMSNHDNDFVAIEPYRNPGQRILPKPQDSNLHIPSESSYVPQIDRAPIQFLPIPPEFPVKRAKQEHFPCNVCGIVVDGSAQLSEHLLGKAHQRRLAKQTKKATRTLRFAEKVDSFSS